MLKNNWYKKSYRRNLVDMHIDDWNKEFLSKLDVDEYIKCMKKAKVDNVMVYAQSHVGLCYWPTSFGKMHRGLNARDFIGEFIQKAHSEGLSVVLYYSLIYDNWAYEQNPEWRTVGITGLNSREKSLKWEFGGTRYGIVCPNNASYREYASNQVKELALKYTPEGIFLDMTFWPDLCFCDTCRSRYKLETDMDIPEVLDWKDPQWIHFQQKREAWIAEFAKFITNAIKNANPELTVSHNYATASLNWYTGITERIVDASDYVGGDLYGGFLQESLLCKYYRNITRNMPFEYMTSRCSPGLLYHTTTKTRDELKLHTYISLAHGGAFLFIDAINPDGTLNSSIYDMMGELFNESLRYEAYIGGKLIRDVAIYYSQESKITWKHNGMHLNTLKHEPGPDHMDACIKTAHILRNNHIPFDVISRNILTELGDCQLVILPYARLIDDEEAKLLRQYVEYGGNLLVTCTPMNKKMQEFIGIEFIDETKETVTYMKPTEAGASLMPGYSANSPLAMPERQDIVNVSTDTEVLATITLPYTDPSDNSIFAAIHSNPPGIKTNYPAITRRKVGEGIVVWTAAPIEYTSPEVNKNVFYAIVKSLIKKPLKCITNAPWSVEVLAFDQPDNSRMIVHLINEQDNMPLIPVFNIGVIVGIHGKKIKSLKALPEGGNLPFKADENQVMFSIPCIDVYTAVSIEYLTDSD